MVSIKRSMQTISVDILFQTFLTVYGFYLIFYAKDLCGLSLRLYFLCVFTEITALGFKTQSE